MAGQAT